MQKNLIALMAFAALLFTGCGGGNGGAAAPAPSNPPITTASDYAKSWIFLQGGNTYATITFSPTGAISADTNSEFLSGSVTPTAGATCSITETTSSTPPGGGAAVTITTTYTGTLSADKNSMYGMYSWSGGGSSGTGKWCATVQGQPYLTNADLTGTWTVTTNGSSYASFTFDNHGAMTANTNTDYIGGSGSVIFTGGLGLQINEQTHYTPSGGTLTTVTNVYSGTANATKDTLSGTSTSVAGSNHQTGTWTATKAPPSPISRG